jgi:hypothetical protein
MSYPGRRIAVMIDASSSMMARFPAGDAEQERAERGDLFFTTVAAAEAFMRQRMAGKYHDLIRADRVRRRSLRRHTLHDRLRQHPAQHVADRRLDRVHEVPDQGDDRAAIRQSTGLFRRSTSSTPPAT